MRNPFELCLWRRCPIETSALFCLEHLDQVPPDLVIDLQRAVAGNDLHAWRTAVIKVHELGS